MADPRHRNRPLVLAMLAGLALLAAILFMTVGARGNWAFVLPFRGTKLAALVAVAVAIALATVLFQTITRNRILTPEIMGFDALFIAIQTLLVFLAGSDGAAAIPVNARFAIEAGAMTAVSLLLFYAVFIRSRHSLHLVVLAGIVLGIFFRSVSTMLQRLLDPNEFSILQDLMFASFNSVETHLIGVGLGITAAACVVMARLAPTLDVLALGREEAISLGLEYDRLVLCAFALVTLLIAVSAALVGPVMFFGLLVANLAYEAMDSHRHRFTLPAAALIAIIALVGGQALLEHAFGLDTALSIIVEFAGGIFFIFLLLRSARR